MKTKACSLILTVLFPLALGGMLLAFLLLPREEFSVREKRFLAAPPALRLSEVVSGRFGEDAESFVSEHLPGRDFLVGLNAYYDLLCGRETAAEVRLGRDGWLFEAPVGFDGASLARNTEAVSAFAEKAGVPVTLMLVPAAGSLLPEKLPPLIDPYPDSRILAEAAALSSDAVHTLDLMALFGASDDPSALFYRTDHHWSSAGARLACSAFAAAQGLPFPAAEDYRVTAVPGFTGTTYSRSALWGTPPETLELWDSGGAFTVENRESGVPHEGLFYTERLEEPDKYPVFLDGNHSLVRVHNPAGSGRLLVIRDSFANCLGCFLADCFAEVVLVDLRYYKTPVSSLLEEGNFDGVLFVYGAKNFMTDVNLARLS